MANWNASFDGFPKEMSDRTVFGSDKALKYAMKKIWTNQGKSVLYLKSYKFKEGKKEKPDKLQPRNLKERYKHVFDTEINDKADSKEILKNLFAAVDVRQFGATFAESSNNISITGAVQVGQGIAKYDQGVVEQQILSPFRDPNKPDAIQTSLGTKITSEETHYFYPVSINPESYKDYVNLDVTDGYTEEDYQNFKQVALVAATALNTNSKAGCENEFTMFVEVDKDIYLPDLTEYIGFEKIENGKDKIIIELAELLNGIDVKAIEIFYNTKTLDIITDVEIKSYNIFTREEVK